jgi:hypothetical protein
MSVLAWIPTMSVGEDFSGGRAVLDPVMRHYPGRPLRA